MNYENGESGYQLLSAIKNKIHKKCDPEKHQNLIRVCGVPPGIQTYSQDLRVLKLNIPFKDMTEELLWDIHDDQPDHQLFRNLFAIIMDLIGERYPEELDTMSAEQAVGILSIQRIEIVESCIAQVRQQLANEPQYRHELCLLDSELMNADTLINIQLHAGKVKEVIQWDLENDFSYIDHFAFSFCYENKLDQQYQIIIGNQIRNQLLECFEKRAEKAAKIEHLNKNQVRDILSYPAFEHYADISEAPQNQDITAFLKRNMEFLPNDLSNLFGNRKQMYFMNLLRIDKFVDQEDTHKIQKVNDSKYLDPMLYENLFKKAQS